CRVARRGDGGGPAKAADRTGLGCEFCLGPRIRSLNPSCATDSFPCDRGKNGAKRARTSAYPPDHPVILFIFTVVMRTLNSFVDSPRFWASSCHIGGLSI